MIVINELRRAVRIRSKLAKSCADTFAYLDGRCHQRVTRLPVVAERETELELFLYVLWRPGLMIAAVVFTFALYLAVIRSG